MQKATTHRKLLVPSFQWGSGKGNFFKGFPVELAGGENMIESTLFQNPD